MRRDALARNLCARISDERKTEVDLRILDVVLTTLEAEEAPSSLLKALEHEQFHEEESDGRDYRAGWNAAMRRAAALVRLDDATQVPIGKVPEDIDPRVLAGLRELATMPIAGDRIIEGLIFRADETPPVVELEPAPLPPAPRPAVSMFDVSDLEDRHE